MSYNCFTVDCRAGLSCSISPVFLSLSYSVYLYWARLSVLLKLFCTSVFFFPYSISHVFSKLSHGWLTFDSNGFVEVKSL